MKLFRKHPVWWIILLTLTVAVSRVTSAEPGVENLLYSVAGHFAFSFVVSLIPLIVYKAIRKPMNTEEFMATFTVAWLILAVANLWVM
jgi:hypothetical protein